MTSVLVVASDHVGSSMAGPGIRYLWFARELARRGFDVTLVVPFETDLTSDEFTLLVDNPWHASRMTPLAQRHEAVVAQRLPVPTMLALARSRTLTVYDLYAPLTIEHAAYARHGVGERPEFALDELTLHVALETGDAFLCASERQRDLWLGALAAVGRIEPAAYAADPTFRSLVAVVPFGIDPSPPLAGQRVLKGVMAGIEETDKVALWGGGIWDWLDPLTVVRAVHAIGRNDVKLVFLGTRSPNPGVPQMQMQARAVALARELRLLGKTVFFNDGWVPYEARGAYLLEADVGCSAHFDELETRFAFRTRLLDCIWAGLPVVTTTGDALAEVVRERGLGYVVGYQDVDGYARALDEVLDRDRTSFAAGVAEARRQFSWPEVVGPVADVIGTTAKRPRKRHPPDLLNIARYGVLRGRIALDARGIAGIGTRIGAAAARRARGDFAAHPHVTERGDL